MTDTITYTYICPSCDQPRQLSGNPKYQKTGNIRMCRPCAYEKRLKTKRVFTQSSLLYVDCTRTMSEVAELVGCSKPTVCNIETRAFLKIYDHISEALGMPLITLEKKKNSNGRLAMKHYLSSYYLDEANGGGYTKESAIETFKNNKPDYSHKKQR